MPVPGAGVMAYWYCLVQRALIPVDLFLKWTDDDGGYRLGGLDDNTYYSAFHGDYAGSESEWYDDYCGAAKTNEHEERDGPSKRELPNDRPGFCREPVCRTIDLGRQPHRETTSYPCRH